MKNWVAIMNLTMAFQTQELMDLIQQTQDDDWPTGQTHLVVKRLLNKYQPHDIMAGVEMKKQLDKLRMRQNDDPSRFFEKLRRIETQYRKPMQEEDKWA